VSSFSFPQGCGATLIRYPVARLVSRNVCAVPLFGFSITRFHFSVWCSRSVCVDDAIVVSKQSSVTSKKEMSPRDATLQAMRECRTVIGIALCFQRVLFRRRFCQGLPADISQFALTIDLVIFSAFNALSLSLRFGAVATAAPENPRPARLVL